MWSRGFPLGEKITKLGLERDRGCILIWHRGYFNRTYLNSTFSDLSGLFLMLWLHPWCRQKKKGGWDSFMIHCDLSFQATPTETQLLTCTLGPKIPLLIEASNYSSTLWETQLLMHGLRFPRQFEWRGRSCTPQICDLFLPLNWMGSHDVFASDSFCPEKVFRLGCRVSKSNMCFVGFSLELIIGIVNLQNWGVGKTFLFDFWKQIFRWPLTFKLNTVPKKLYI